MVLYIGCHESISKGVINAIEETKKKDHNTSGVSHHDIMHDPYQEIVFKFPCYKLSLLDCLLLQIYYLSIGH